MHRASEPTIVWIEGADVLTPEAQAFLRRIIETCSKHVEFILETRDETRISSPIKSRCITIYFDLPLANKSWRSVQYDEQFIKLPKRVRDSILVTRDMEDKWLNEALADPIRGVQKARIQSLDPAILLEKVLQRLDPLKRDMYRRAWGTGRSIWALLALAVLDAVE
jgi:DNA polymerase III delta prime subunit